MSLLIVGSVAFDDVETIYGKAERVVGGSATFGSYAASLFTDTSLVAVVGKDFPQRELNMMQKRGADIEGIQVIPDGETFHWSGRYNEDFSSRETLFTKLNVFEDFSPALPTAYRRIPRLFLANIDPELQLDVLGQAHNPELVVCDTMNLWIEIRRKALEKLLKKIDVLLLNDEEALMLADATSLADAAYRLRRKGIARLIIKKGEHGCLMFGPEGCFAAPALPLRKFKDPTGAGDSFAGGMMGWLAGRQLTPGNWRKAILVGTAMASFAVEDFSVRRLRKLTKEQLQERLDELHAMTKVQPVRL